MCVSPTSVFPHTPAGLSHFGNHVIHQTVVLCVLLKVLELHLILCQAVPLFRALCQSVVCRVGLGDCETYKVVCSRGKDGGFSKRTGIRAMTINGQLERQLDILSTIAKFTPTATTPYQHSFGEVDGK